jgi:uncharacterized protein YecE (DUF72 family)
VPGSPAVAFSEPAPGVAVGGCRVLAGSSSWADRSLVREGTFYPSRSLGAAQRLAFYASRLPLTEVATTYRFPPTPEVAARWVASTPPGFTMDVRAWSLLSGAPTWPESLWPDLQGHIKPPRRESTKLYRHRLPADVVDECWLRFHHAVSPLAQAGRLGAVIVRFPSWFRPGPSAWEELAALPARLAGFRVAVEMNNERWFEGDTCDHTLALLEGLGLCFVCHDRPGPARPVVAATADVAFVRFPGRSPHTWDGPRPGAPNAGLAEGGAGPHGADEGGAAAEVEAEVNGEVGGGLDLGEDGGVGTDSGQGSSAHEAPEPAVAWWSYRYSEAELAAWVPAVQDLASGTSEVHLIMDNCWRADAVDNAATLLQLLEHA